MSGQAALKSKDLPEVQKARSTVKGQITTGVRKLESIFEMKIGQDFDHSNISRAEVNLIHNRLEENFQLLEKLHLKCCEMRDKGKDSADEDDLVVKEGEYSEEISCKVFPLLDKFVQYERSYSPKNLY